MLSIALVTLLASSPEIPVPKVDMPATKPGSTRSIVLGMGCFWCSEAVFEHLEGVTDVVSGYAGDTQENAKYDLVSDHKTKHAEVVRVTYDPTFFTTHDPTTLDRQGPDAGHQYRSAIFYANDEEKKIAEAYIAQLTDAKVYSAKIVTTLEPLTAFYPAEEYHQNFVARNPNHGYVRMWAVPKIEKVRTKLADIAKKK
jgi:peptide-methionine (S)-S-oxide reductase